MDRSNEENSILDNYMSKTPKELFKVWHYVFRKEYTFDSDEAKKRFSIFKQNLAEIKLKNSQNLEYQLGLNQFADMSDEEFKETMLSKSLGPEIEESLDLANKELGFLEEPKVEEPKIELGDDDDDLTKRNLETIYVNWSKYFPPARTQQTCGGCWSFSIVAAIEGNNSKKLGKVSNYLSPQQLLDCDTENKGCVGGDIRKGLNYVIEKGLMYESDYPYINKASTCKYSSSKPKVQISGYDYCSNYSSLKKCTQVAVYNLLKKGPVSVLIDGASNDFRYYKTGVFSGACSNINHAVVLVGYGVSGSTRFWIVRNSWGSNWGDKGFIRVKVNSSNNLSCFIEFQAVLPIMK